MMYPLLVINNVDFKDWLKEDGIKYSKIERVKRSVVTMGGTEYRKTIEKDKLDVTLLDMPDSELQIVEAALASAKPAVVNYTTKEGTARTGVAFYASSIAPTAHRVYGTSGSYSTEFTGITFTLEER